MNLIIQRIVRQGLTAAAGFLTAKGILIAEQSGAWINAGTEFVAAIVMGGLAFAWSTFNAKVLKRGAQKQE